jgi:hypothetical protein
VAAAPVTILSVLAVTVVAAAGTVSAAEPPTAVSALPTRPVAVLVTVGPAPEVIALTVPVTSWTVLGLAAWAAGPIAAVGWTPATVPWTACVAPWTMPAGAEVAEGAVTLGTALAVTVLTAPATGGSVLAAVD